MATTLSVAEVLIRWRQEGAKEVQAQTTSLGKTLDGIGSKAKAAGAALSVGLTAPLVLIGKQALSAASDLNESMSAVSTVFGSTASEMTAFARSAATNLGQSQQAALSAASALGALFKGVGLNNDQMADFSKNVLQASADLGSFFNIDPGEALRSLRGGLVGESEGLRRFGILLNETAVKAKAVELGIAGANDELTEGQKVQARYALIMEQIGAAQGDFARTSGGLANGSRILRARLADLSAQIGKVLLPYALQASQVAGELIDRFLSLDEGTQRLAVAFGAAAAAAGPALIVFGQVASSAAKIGPILSALTGPLGLVVAAVAGLGVAYKTNVLGFADAVDSVASTVQQSLGRIVQAFDAATDRGVNPFLAALRALNVATVEGFGRGNPIAEFFRAVFVNANRLAEYFDTTLLPAFRRIGDAFRGGGIGDALRQALSELPAIGADLMQQVRRLVGPVIDAVRGIDWDAVGGELWRRLIGAIRGIDWDGVGDALGGLVQRGLAALSNVGSWVLAALRGEGAGGGGHRGKVLGNLAGALLGFLRERFARVDWAKLGDDLLVGLQRAVALAFDLARWGWDRVKDLASFVAGKFGEVDWGAVGEAALAGLQSATQLAVTFARWGWDRLKDLASFLVGAINDVDWDSVKRTLGDWAAIAAAEFSRWMQDRLGDLRNLATWVLDRIKEVDWTEVLGNFKDAGLGLIGELLTGMGEKMRDVQRWITGGPNPEGGTSQGIANSLWTHVTGAFAKVKDDLIEAGKAPFQWLWDGMMDKWAEIEEWLGTLKPSLPNVGGGPGPGGGGRSATGGPRGGGGGGGGFDDGEERFTRGAMGTLGRGNWAVVGEYGPELVKLPTGAMVIPHGASMARLGDAVSRLAAGGVAGKGWINWFNDLSDAERRRRYLRGINRELPPGWRFAEDYSIVPPGFYALPAGMRRAEDGSTVPVRYYDDERTRDRDRGRVRTRDAAEEAEMRDRDRRDRDRRERVRSGARDGGDLAIAPTDDLETRERNRDRRERASAFVNESRPLGHRRNPMSRQELQDYQRQVNAENREALIPPINFYGNVTFQLPSADIGYEVSRYAWEQQR